MTMTHVVKGKFRRRPQPAVDPLAGTRTEGPVSADPIAVLNERAGTVGLSAVEHHDEEFANLKDFYVLSADPKHPNASGLHLRGMWVVGHASTLGKLEQLVDAFVENGGQLPHPEPLHPRAEARVFVLNQELYQAERELAEVTSRLGAKIDGLRERIRNLVEVLSPEWHREDQLAAEAAQAAAQAEADAAAALRARVERVQAVAEQDGRSVEVDATDPPRYVLVAPAGHRDVTFGPGDFVPHPVDGSLWKRPRLYRRAHGFEVPWVEPTLDAVEKYLGITE
ncbi:hypothetical protein [Rhodococcus ruber]|uniref:hypothetical protein n=1 Tax=Rhodococcus ruber TaxID=1830 RepID=UPI001F168C2B|nr:hypothetical protein [Rhodococcus ruber]MCF8786876.1 hypothetical protein [Rhodococcus ruber]